MAVKQKQRNKKRDPADYIYVELYKILRYYSVVRHPLTAVKKT